MIKGLQDNFWLRRFHSLSGIVPIGGFVLFHIFANSTAIFSADNYNMIINFLRSLPFVEAIEWGFIFLPLIFHAGYGIVIYTTAKPTHAQYSNSENFRYIVQRATGMIALVFIIYHVIQFKTVHDLDYNYIAKTFASGQDIPNLPAIPLLNPFSIYWFYVIGVTSSVFHLANGLWGFCITWGITTSKKAQDAVTLIGIGLFVVFTFMGIETANHLAEAGKALL